MPGPLVPVATSMVGPVTVAARQVPSEDEGSDHECYRKHYQGTREGSKDVNLHG